MTLRTQGGAFRVPAGQLSSEELDRLGVDDRWRGSRFGALEEFVFDFLCGGRGSGEAVRLKLQTPLFVADALLEAAGNLLQAELQTAEEVRPPLWDSEMQPYTLQPYNPARLSRYPGSPTPEPVAAFASKYTAVKQPGFISRGSKQELR